MREGPRNRVTACALALLAGVLAVHGGASPPSPGRTMGVGVAALGAAAWLRAPWPLAAAAGFLLAGTEARRLVADRLDPALAGEVLQVVGTVVSVPVRSPGRVQFEFAPESVEWSGTASGLDAGAESPADAPRLPARVRLAWYDDATDARRETSTGPRSRDDGRTSLRVAPGEHWRFSVKLRAPRGFANPGGFDAEQRAAIDGIGAGGYVHDETEPLRLAATGAVPVERARARLAAAIARAVPDSPSTGLVQALAVGVQDAVPDEQWRLFRLAGITHLVAISGLHVTLFALVVATGVRLAFRLPPFGRWMRFRIPAEVGLGLAAAIGYSLLAGWSVPTQRTVLMLAVYAGAKLARRAVAPATLLAAALVVVLVHDPLAALTAGFWLSFGAVAAILAVAEGRLGAPGVVAAFLATQAAVTLALAPASAAMFGGLTWAGAFVNVVAIPAYSFVAVPLVLAGTALEPVLPALAALAWRLAAAFLDLQWPVLEWVAALPGVDWSPVPPGGAWLVLGIAAVLAALAPLPAAARGAAVVAVGTMLALRAERAPHGHAWVTVLDVGQGLAAAVETRTTVTLYDTGPSWRGGGSAGERVVVPWLRHRGWRRVDVVVVSHADTDHAGGLDGILAAVPVRALLGAARGADHPCRAGDGWTVDGVRFEFVHPDDAPYSDNDGSCVLRVAAGPHRALFTGDVTAAVEGLLAPADVGADVVTVPHHGSRTSSSAGFVAATGARWAVVSAGHANRWGFPKADVVARWRSAGATVAGTAERGALWFALGGRSLLATRGERGDSPRWWRAR